MSVVGSPFVLALDFLKGVLIGFAVGLTVRHLAWKGVVVSLAVVAPQNLVILPALAIASVSAIRFAYYVGRERLFLGRGNLLPPLASHTGTSAALFYCARHCVDVGSVRRAAPRSRSVGMAVTRSAKRNLPDPGIRRRRGFDFLKKLPPIMKSSVFWGGGGRTWKPVLTK
ncbi:stage II sporulation protein M [Cohnella rhizosphaerae]|uniref:Stage II sporulation protein M n=1 Tax=Cohnella rhizosphaerae TaxID=1457232 RepID=A0A9X4KYD3_9BACL|nr:stage II sporulation protein M [Cohnella rhizosphaerae]MDG0813167.1 stage II sporulation protein M [Cohnella rhizosphaerae]